jgi:hypothetical protein
VCQSSLFGLVPRHLNALLAAAQDAKSIATQHQCPKGPPHKRTSRMAVWELVVLEVEVASASAVGP